MGASAAVGIIHRRRINEAEDPEAEREELIADYEDKFYNPLTAAEMGFIDDVLDPRETRPYLIQALSMIRTKRPERPPRKHGNIPL
jgi:propionyl-CoA carboxylase beta chain